MHLGSKSSHSNLSRNFQKNPIFSTQCKIVASVHPKLAGTIKVVDLGKKTRALTKLKYQFCK